MKAQIDYEDENEDEGRPSFVWCNRLNVISLTPTAEQQTAHDIPASTVDLLPDP